MQKSKVNIQKVSANTKSLLENKQGVFVDERPEGLVEGQEFFTLLLLSILALVMILFQNIYVLVTTLKDLLVHQIRTLTLKKVMTWSKLVILAFVACLFFKQEIGLNFNSSGIAFSANNNGADLSGFEGLNPQAPLDLANLHDQQSVDYIKKYAPIAIKEMKKHKIPASVSIAQALIESRAGTSRLALENNNHFGIKCFSKRCSKAHCSNFSDDHHKDFFRKYKSPELSWKDHSQFLLKKRYNSLFQYGKDYRLWAKGLAENGYATDKKYAHKLIRIIEKFELYSFDG